jgi:hypothetical protein
MPAVVVVHKWICFVVPLRVTSSFTLFIVVFFIRTDPDKCALFTPLDVIDPCAAVEFRQDDSIVFVPVVFTQVGMVINVYKNRSPMLIDKGKDLMVKLS